jgi:hypothetical protein
VERVKEDAVDNSDKSPVPKKKMSDSTPPDTDVTLPVPKAVKAIMAEDIHRDLSVFPKGLWGTSSQRSLSELDEELRRKATKSRIT